MSTEQLQTLSQTMERWIAGLQILAASLKGSADPSRLVEELISRQRYLRDYLAAFPLDQQSTAAAET